MEGGHDMPRKQGIELHFRPAITNGYNTIPKRVKDVQLHQSIGYIPKESSILEFNYLRKSGNRTKAFTLIILSHQGGVWAMFTGHYKAVTIMRAFQCTRT